MPVSFQQIAVTATSDGLTTGLISEDADRGFVLVTSASANNIVTLPSADKIRPGWMTNFYVGANGCEVRTDAASGETINGVDSDGTNEAAIPATSLCRVYYVDTDTFIMETIDEGGDDITAIVPDTA